MEYFIQLIYTKIFFKKPLSNFSSKGFFIYNLNYIVVLFKYYISNPNTRLFIFLTVISDDSTI